MLSSSLTRGRRHSYFGVFRVGCLLQHIVRLIYFRRSRINSNSPGRFGSS